MRGLGYVVAAAVSALGCLEPTQVDVVLRTDARCASESGPTAILRNTSITVGKPGEVDDRTPATLTDACFPEGARAAIGDIVLVPGAGTEGSFGLEIVGGVERSAENCAPPEYQGCIVARRVMGFVDHTPLYLPIDLRLSCLDVPCTPDTTCVDGVSSANESAGHQVSFG